MGPCIINRSRSGHRGEGLPPLRKHRFKNNSFVIRGPKINMVQELDYMDPENSVVLRIFLPLLTKEKNKKTEDAS